MTLTKKGEYTIAVDCITNLLLKYNFDKDSDDLVNKKAIMFVLFFLADSGYTKNELLRIAYTINDEIEKNAISKLSGHGGS